MLYLFIVVVLIQLRMYFTIMKNNITVPLTSRHRYKWAGGIRTCAIRDLSAGVD